MSATIGERVAAGAAFLDEHDPDWWREGVENAIDLDRLDLGSPACCILGQRCPAELAEAYIRDRYDILPEGASFVRSYRFWARAHELAGIPVGREGESCRPVVAWSSALGLNSANADPGEFAALAAEWKRVITERRSA